MYLGGTCKELESYPVIIVGEKDHIHIIALVTQIFVKQNIFQVSGFWLLTLIMLRLQILNLLMNDS